MLRMTLYAVVVVCFLVAGIMDLTAGNTKLGAMALLLAALNAIVFFWRDG